MADQTGLEPFEASLAAPRTCSECPLPVAGKAVTCSDKCRQARHRRKKALATGKRPPSPSDPMLQWSPEERERLEALVEARCRCRCEPAPQRWPSAGKTTELPSYRDEAGAAWCLTCGRPRKRVVRPPDVRVVDLREFLSIAMERDGDLQPYPLARRRLPRKWRTTQPRQPMAVAA